MGFGYGLMAGTRAADSWIDRYEEGKEQEIENKLFTAAQKLGEEQIKLDAEGNEIKQAGMMFSKMSPHDVAGALMEQVVAGGGKIDDQTAKLAYGVGEQLVGLKDKFTSYQERRQLFDLKKRNMEGIIQKRSMLTSMRDNLSSGGDGVWKPEFANKPIAFFNANNLAGDKRGVHSARQWDFYNEMKEKNSMDSHNYSGTLSEEQQKYFKKRGYKNTPKGVEKFWKDWRSRDTTISKENRNAKTSIFGDLDDVPEEEFPKSPKRGQGHESENGQYWVYDGKEWRVKEEEVGFLKSLKNKLF